MPNTTVAHGNSTLVQQQADFATRVAQLLLWCAQQGHTATFGECERPPMLAELYAKLGRGIRNSQHGDRLAVDLRLYVQGVYQEKTEQYERLGKYWESLDRRARWGGRFQRQDGNHFEFVDPQEG